MDQDVKFAHICRLFMKPKKKEKENNDTQLMISKQILQSFMFTEKKKNIAQPSLHNQNEIKPNSNMNLKITV